MKATTDLFTSIGIAIAGALIAFFICNMFLPEIKDESFKVVNGSVNVNLAEPNSGIFNSNALNPTVEVYVGDQEESNN